MDREEIPRVYARNTGKGSFVALCPYCEEYHIYEPYYGHVDSLCDLDKEDIGIILLKRSDDD